MPSRGAAPSTGLLVPDGGERPEFGLGEKYIKDILLTGLMTLCDSSC
jgi:hypothetical protein